MPCCRSRAKSTRTCRPSNQPEVSHAGSFALHECARLRAMSPLNPLPEELAPSQADIVIVGAGVTGLSTALALAGCDMSIVVVDRRVGDGATSRSGGIILGDTLTGPA